MNGRDGLPAAGPPPLPARLVPGRLIHIPKRAMFGARRSLDARLIEYRPTRAYNLGELHCVELATGHRFRLWVRPLLITFYRGVLPDRALPVRVYREAC